MDARLKEAAQAGDINLLYNCIHDDADVLRRIDEAEFIDTPLHIAAARGHTDFAMALMNLKPSLARKLNQDIFSPMHLALQNDHEETVLRLFAVEKDLVRVKGKEGYTPFHHVVRQEKLDLLAQFLRDCPACVEDVKIKSQTALHIAAQDNRSKALKILTRWIQRTDIHGKVSRKHVLDLKDRDGNTVLHIAAANNQPRMIELLLECDVDTKETDMSDNTALAILENQSKSDDTEKSLKFLCDFERRGWNPFKALLKSKDTGEKSLQKSFSSKISWKERAISSLLNLSAERINAVLVVLALILTATYQAMLTPPGVLVALNSGNDTLRKVGTAADYKGSFLTFVIINFLVFVYTSFFTVGLRQIATGDDSGIVIVVIEVLLTLLNSCLAIVFQFTAPKNGPKCPVSVWGFLEKYTPVFVTVGAVVLLEMGRRFPRGIITHRRLKYFKKIFHEL